MACLLFCWIFVFLVFVIFMSYTWCIKPFFTNNKKASFIIVFYFAFSWHVTFLSNRKHIFLPKFSESWCSTWITMFFNSPVCFFQNFAHQNRIGFHIQGYCIPLHNSDILFLALQCYINFGFVKLTVKKCM